MDRNFSFDDDHCLRDYSIPFLDQADEDIIMKSQIGNKVVFLGVSEKYPAKEDIQCDFLLREPIANPGDRIAIYELGWTNIKDWVAIEWVNQKNDTALSLNLSFSINFPACAGTEWRKGDLYFQFCYISHDDKLYGASGPFQFKIEEEIFSSSQNYVDMDMSSCKNPVWFPTSYNFPEGNKKNSLEKTGDEASNLPEAMQKTDTERESKNAILVENYKSLQEAIAFLQKEVVDLKSAVKSFDKSSICSSSNRSDISSSPEIDAKLVDKMIRKKSVEKEQNAVLNVSPDGYYKGFKTVTSNKITGGNVEANQEQMKGDYGHQKNVKYQLERLLSLCRSAQDIARQLVTSSAVDMNLKTESAAKELETNMDFMHLINDRLNDIWKMYSETAKRNGIQVEIIMEDQYRSCGKDPSKACPSAKGQENSQEASNDILFNIVISKHKNTIKDLQEKVNEFEKEREAQVLKVKRLEEIITTFELHALRKIKRSEIEKPNEEIETIDVEKFKNDFLQAMGLQMENTALIMVTNQYNLEELKSRIHYLEKKKISICTSLESDLAILNEMTAQIKRKEDMIKEIVEESKGHAVKLSPETIVTNLENFILDMMPSAQRPMVEKLAPLESELNVLLKERQDREEIRLSNLLEKESVETEIKELKDKEKEMLDGGKDMTNMAHVLEVLNKSVRAATTDVLGKIQIKMKKDDGRSEEVENLKKEVSSCRVEYTKLYDEYLKICQKMNKFILKGQEKGVLVKKDKKGYQPKNSNEMTTTVECPLCKKCMERSSFNDHFEDHIA